MSTYILSVTITSDGSHYSVGRGALSSETRGDRPSPAEDPLCQAIAAELNANAEEIARRIRTGDYVGGYVKADDGTWTKDQDDAA